MPFSALRRDRDGEYVFRIETDNKARRVAVRGGRRQASRVEVLEGLTVGDQVVTKGFLGLSDGKVVTRVDSSTDQAQKTRAAPRRGQS